MRIVAALLMLSLPASASALRVRANMTGDMSIGPVLSSVDSFSPTFDLMPGSTTPNNLSDGLVVNSVSMTLVLACDAQGVSGTSWTCRDSSGPVTLSEAGTGTSPSTTTLSPFHAHDAAERVVAYQAGKRHDAASSSVADLTTDDLAIEYVGKLGSTSGATILDKGVIGTDGWRLSQVGTSQLTLQLRTASTTTSINSPTGHAVAFVHGIAFVDRSEVSTNGAVFYANGAAGTGVDASARSASLSNAATMAVGANTGGTANNNTVASIRLWRCSGCFAGGATNPTQWAPIARARAAVAWGISPTIAAGIAGPTTLARASTGFIDVVDGSTRQLYLSGSNAPRVSVRKDSSGNNVTGYISEPASTNVILQSQTLGTTWTVLTVGDAVLADSFAGADLTTTGDDIDAVDATNAEHGVRQTSSVLTAATYTFSVWAKKGTQHHIYLRNNTIASGFSFFNMNNCEVCSIGNDCSSAVGTVGAGVIQARAERWPVDTTGDGVADVNLCRAMITFTATAVAHDFDLGCANQDNNFTYTDNDSTADCGFWGVRLEQFSTATSYLATTTGSVVRNGDDLRYDGASHYTGSPSTMDVAVLCPNFNTESATTFTSVGSTSTNYARLGIDPTNDRGLGEASVTTQQWNILAASGDVSDGVAHTLRQTMATNAITAYVDGVNIGNDTSANLPATASAFVYFGNAPTSGTISSACLISRARLWSSLVAP